MFFEAEIKQKHFKVNVTEDKTAWKVSLQEEDKEWVHHRISKRNHIELEQILLFVFKGGSYLMDVTGSDTHYNVYARGSYRSIKIYNDEMILHESLKKGSKLGNDSTLVSGMPGKIVKVYVKAGDAVKEGQPLLVMEAMKMENEMRAAKDVVIKEVKVEAGSAVDAGSLLISFVD